MTLKNGKYKLGAQRWTIEAEVVDGKLSMIMLYEDEFRECIGHKMDNPWMWVLVEQALAAGFIMEPYPKQST